jgi:hypothetical protein
MSRHSIIGQTRRTYSAKKLETAIQSAVKTNVILRLVWWTVYAAALGYVEALVVVYIRRLAGMAPGLDYDQIWALRGLTLSSASIVWEMKRLGIWNAEVTREIATIVVLAGAACAAERSLRTRFAIFLYTFAVWDLTYYLWLKLWTGFPQSLASTDIYYLVPIGWYGPVWFPVVVIMPALIAISVWLLSTEHTEQVKQEMESTTDRASREAA